MSNVLAFETIPWREKANYQSAWTITLDQGAGRKCTLPYAELREGRYTKQGTVVLGFSTKPGTWIRISGQNLKPLYEAVFEHRVEAIWISHPATAIKNGARAPRVCEIVIDLGG